MHKIAKRLELIKTSITIEDEDIINLQVAKLKSMDVDKEVENILSNLDKNDYSTSLMMIEKYLSTFRSITVYEDEELNSLKLELKVLENKISKLNEKKSEYLNKINDFHNKYNLTLGELIEDILKLRKEILYKKIAKKKETLEEKKNKLAKDRRDLDDIAERIKKVDPFDEEYDELYQKFKKQQERCENQENELNEEDEKIKNDEEYKEYQQAEEEYKEYSEEYSEIKDMDINELTDEELAELKKLYKKAAKLCHPDIVIDKLKQKALQFIQELNKAYEKRELEKIKNILSSLESGNAFHVPSDTINDKAKLKEKITQARAKIEEILKEIDEIENTDTFKTINEINDVDSYLENLKTQLLKEKENLIKEVNSYNKKTEESEEDDDFWASEF